MISNTFLKNAEHALLIPEFYYTAAATSIYTLSLHDALPIFQGGGGSWELRVMADGRFGATFYQSIGPDVFTEIVSPLTYNRSEERRVGKERRSRRVRV